MKKYKGDKIAFYAYFYFALGIPTNVKINIDNQMMLNRQYFYVSSKTQLFFTVA